MYMQLEISGQKQTERVIRGSVQSSGNSKTFTLSYLLVCLQI